ncbi:MAG: c-type cytochrome [Alphaproteobacteria bacterium]|nr:c-type cytochrome [Alphaproteobacteria bacterium]
MTTPTKPVFAAFGGVAAIVAAIIFLGGQSTLNQPSPTQQSPAPPANGQTTPEQKPARVPPPPSLYGGSIPAAALLRVPVTGVVPGNVNTAPNIKSPLANDPNAAQRGMKDFDAFNCSGCHAANGAGGMGPSLSDNIWIYRSSPANIYLTIVQGRAKGMPAFGAMLPDRVIWELVSYIQSISEPPTGQFGKTTSRDPLSPDVEQVPPEKMQTPQPWNFTESFSKGQRPGAFP